MSLSTWAFSSSSQGNQMRNIISPACSGSALGSPTRWLCQENLQRKRSREHPDQKPESLLLCAPSELLIPSLGLSQASLWRKLILAAWNHNLILHSLPRARDHRWGFVRRSTDKSKALPSGSSPFSPCRSGTTAASLLAPHPSACWMSWSHEDRHVGEASPESSNSASSTEDMLLGFRSSSQCTFHHSSPAERSLSQALLPLFESPDGFARISLRQTEKFFVIASLNQVFALATTQAAAPGYLSAASGSTSTMEALNMAQSPTSPC